jgi:ABC-type methionine transport system ATPase subunit
LSDAQKRGFRLQGVSVTTNGATILQDIELSLPGGAWTAIVGASGSGKTTLLRVLNRLNEPSAGTIAFGDRALADYDVRVLRRMVGLVVQQPRLGAGSARGTIELPARLGAISGEIARQRLPWACEIAQLPASLLDRDLHALSGGERQRVALARALMLEPAALLLDEPTAALDRETARRMIAALDGLRRERAITIVTVTHRVEELSAFEPYCAVLEQGRLLEHGPAAQLRSVKDHARAD